MTEKLLDIVVAVDDPKFIEISNFLSNLERDSVLFPSSLFFTNAEGTKSDAEDLEEALADYDKQISEKLCQIEKHVYNYQFYKLFEDKPRELIDNYLVQQRVLLLMMKEESKAMESRWDYGSAEFYKEFEVFK